MSEVIVWTGWIGGVAIGLYSLAQFWMSGKQLGCSSAYCHMCNPISQLEFFRNADFELNSWRTWFVLGIPLGGLLAVLTSPGAEWQVTMSMGQLYDSVLPESMWLKVPLLFGGGLLMGLGARMAGGCTSGHVIAGVSLLNLPSILAGALFFVGGLVVVQVMFRLLA